MEDSEQRESRLIAEAETLRARIAVLERRERELKVLSEDERERMDTDRRFHAHLLDSVDQAIIALDREGTILFWNRFAEQLYGWPPEEVIGRNAIDILPANEWSSSLFRGGAQGARVSGEYLFRQRSGAPFPVMVTHSPIFDERGEIDGMVSISCDISERKRTEQELNRFRSHLADLVEEKTAELRQANEQLEREIKRRRVTEEALRASERKLRSILEESRDGIGLADERGVIVEWNAAAAKMSGIPIEEALGKAAWEIQALMIPEKSRNNPELSHQIEISLREALRTGKASWFNTPMVTAVLHPDTKARILQLLTFPIPAENGYMIGGISRDITAQKRIEEKLSRSRAHLTLAERLAHLGSFQFEVSGDEVIWSSETFRIVARDPQLGPPTKKEYIWFVHPDDRFQMRRTILRTIARGEPFDIEYRVVPGDGSVKHMRSIGRAVFDTEGKVRRVFGTIQDITDRKRSEVARERTIELLHLFNRGGAIRDKMRMLIGLLREWSGCEAVGIRLREGDDYPYYETCGFAEEFVLRESSLCAGEREGRFGQDERDVPFLECMCGNILQGRFDPSKPFFTPRGSFHTNSTTGLLASIDPSDRHAPTRNRCNSAGYESVALIPLRHYGETYGLLQFNDRQKGRFTPELLSFLETVGDHVAIALAADRMEAQFRKQKDFYESILEATAEGVLVTDRNDCIRYANRSMEILLGTPREGIIGNNLLRDLPEETVRFFRPLYEKTRESLFPFFSDPIPVVTPDGRHTFQSGWLVPRKSDGRFEGMIITLYDVTEQLKMEEEVQKSRKLESIGVLAGGIAHNFNNIHTAILGSIALAKMDTPRDDPRYAALLEAEESIIRAQDLTHRLITFSRGGKPMVKQRPIGPLLREESESALRDSEIHCRYSIPEGLPPVEIDSQQIRHAISGIVSNAREAMRDTGEMEISAEEVLIGANDPLPVCPGRYIRIRIRDNGPGIPPEFTARLFDPFFTTKPGHNGLGLTTSFSIIRNHEGYLTAESGKGSGAAFSLYLPVGGTPAESADRSSGSLRIPVNQEKPGGISAKCHQQGKSA